MAESYVTRFTKYVANQRDNLEAKLKGKGLTLSPDLALGSLVSQLDALQDKYRPIAYERDKNLPNFDEMFDNDPLRAVNGGEYKGCYYALYIVDVNGVVGVRASGTYCVHSYCDKIVFSDGAEYTKGQTIVHTVGESGVYTDSNGTKYALVKGYSFEPVVVNFYQQPDPFIEVIDDMFIGSYWYWDQTSGATGYIYPVYCLQYWRYVGTNNTIDNIFSNQYGYWNLTYMVTQLKSIRIDSCLHRFYNSGQLHFPSLSQYVDNGVVYGSSTTATSVTFNLGSTYDGRATYYGDVLKIPNSELPTYTVAINGQGFKTIYIPDSVTSFTMGGKMYVYGGVETVHIGNGLTNAFPTISYTSLKNITVSPNAFNANSTAITIDLSKNILVTRESLLNMINNFADRTDKTANVLKLTNYSKSLLTDEEKAILTNKNWTIS